MRPSRSCRYCHQIFQPFIDRSKACVVRRSVSASDAAIITAKESGTMPPTPRHARQPEEVACGASGWKQYRQQHPESVERNRRQQQQRDQKRRVVNLAKMNLALDLKREASEVWFVGPVVKDLAKNNLAQSKVFIYQGFQCFDRGLSSSCKDWSCPHF